LTLLEADPVGTAPVPDRAESGSPVPHVRVAVVGSGFSGLGAAIRLKRDGVDDFVILERAEDVGGTWRDNTYPAAPVTFPPSSTPSPSPSTPAGRAASRRSRRSTSICVAAPASRG